MKGTLTGDDTASFVHDEGDMTGLRSGANFSDSDPFVIREMILAVVRDWDFDKFKQDDKVGLG